MSLAASGVGGYMAGRLRKKWLNVRTDEVYFRDTAHGLLAWGLSTLAMATLLASVTGAIVTGGAKAGADALGGVTAAASAAAASAGNSTDGDQGGMTANPLDYFVDTLFRDEGATRTANPSAQDRSERTAEVSRIFMNALAQEGELNADDRRYIARLVAQNTNLTQQQAEARVNEVYESTRQRLDELEATAREAAETARKASAYTSLWLSVALLIGAFVASLAATWGGRQRDY